MEVNRFEVFLVALDRLQLALDAGRDAVRGAFEDVLDPLPFEPPVLLEELPSQPDEGGRGDDGR